MKIPLLLTASMLFLLPLSARAHCDTLDGPVVKTARAALEKREVATVLAWVKPDHEREVRIAFSKAVLARRDPASREASDHAFFETLVRAHRAGEGEAYTGLKPSGSHAGEAVSAADLAIEKRDPALVQKVVTERVQAGLRQRLARLNALQQPGKDVAAGRAWVEAYVDYVHYVEQLDAGASGGGQHAHGAAYPQADHHATPQAHEVDHHTTASR